MMEEPVCDYCDRTNPSGQEFCVRCGQPLVSGNNPTQWDQPVLSIDDCKEPVLISEECFLIGSGKAANLQLGGPSGNVLPSHAVIFRRSNGQWAVLDLAGGDKRTGFARKHQFEPLEGIKELAPRDRLRIGQFVVTCLLPYPASYRGNNPYVFISYDHQDKDLVYDVIRRLVSSQYRVYYDHDFERGKDWKDQARDRIDHASAIIVFLSGTAIRQSAPLRWEVSTACAREARQDQFRIIPVVMKNVEESQWEEALRADSRSKANEGLTPDEVRAWEQFIRERTSRVLLYWTNSKDVSSEIIRELTRMPGNPTYFGRRSSA